MTTPTTLDTLLFERNPQGIILVNKKEGTSSANPAAKAILGYTGENAESIIPYLFSHTKDRAALLPAYKAFLKNPENDAALDIEMVNDQGTGSHARLAASQAVDGTVCIYVTDTNTAFKRQSLLSQAGHDLRTPLNGIMGFAHLIQHTANGTLTGEKDSPLNREEITTFASYIMASSDNLLKMIDRINHEAKGTAAPREEYHLKKTIDAQASIYQDALARKGMTLENNIPEDVVVIADQGVVSVIDNLVTNAIKYASEGRRIVFEGVKEKKDEITIKAIDYGRGIPDEEKKHIFDSGYRASSARVSEQAGDGLGLANVKTIIEGYGGRIKVYDNKPSGTVFEFSLPRR